MRSLLVWCILGIPAAAADYARDVEPLLRARCYGCHGAARQMKGLRLDSKDAVLAAGGVLIARVTGEGVSIMPPAGKPLSATEVATLREFIGGARATHWAFQPVARPVAPRTRNAEWPRNAVDQFVLARLERANIEPSPAASRRTLIRRLSFDLTGLPPSPEEVAEFVSDARPDAYEKLVDRLLASPHFGERWARPWLDRARYADSDGYEKDWFRPWAWRYRDYVIRAFNRDLPFDRFTTEQLAGDLLPDATADQRIATGFYRMTLTNREGGVDNAQFRFESTVDRANTVASVWMGLTAGCAQCHNHKFDPITQRDYYSLFAYFDNLHDADIEAPLAGELGPWLAAREAYRAKRAETLKAYHVPELQAAWERDMLDAAEHPGRRTDWDLAWDCLLKLTEGGWDGERLIRTPPARRTEREAATLTDHFVRNYHFAVGGKRTQELKFPELDQKLTALKKEFPQLSEAMAVTEADDPEPSHVRVRGDYKTPGERVEPAVPAFLPPAGGGSRLDLARWLVSEQNPLTARVTVNWIWQELFGAGLVKSAEDFGTRGEKPTHPELLDWLAASFREEGWSVKQLIRTIVVSNTYRQSSHARRDLETIDPQNALLARQSRLRLPAELIRDNALSVSGLLDTEVGGESVRPPQPKGVSDLGYGKREGDTSWKVSEGRKRYRRGLYIQFQRSTPYPLLVNFDAPKTTVAVCRRDRSNTPLQALNLLNDPVFVEAAEALAYAVPRGDVKMLFERALARSPSPKELERMNHYVQTMPWPAVASIVLNLDEFITRE